ncbi:MAG: hypothetical protein H6895_03280 [Defluviimonas sp.]|uniref:DUF6473 family protein n=1 Tax=Albidovulum sp. TaxID=1872424 RepID=UPI002A2C5731|nr:hypothetical protein [Defluviimonas sp.]
MAYEHPGAGALDYAPCRYGQSKLLFRGPRRTLEGDYVAVIGGSETYGRFVDRPFPALVEAALGRKIVNFGYMNAGPDVFLNEAAVLDACAHAGTVVVQAMGAQNLTNRFYAVHPRRNDRFLRASALMKTIFRDVDFTEFHFTRHMLSAIRARSPEKYRMVEDELREAWVARMRLLLQRTGRRTVLLQVVRPEIDGDGLGPEPLFVSDAMIAEVRPLVAEVVTVAPSAEDGAEHTTGMSYAPLEAPIAERMMGPRAHETVAEALAAALDRLT